ncbi:MAG: lytic transglycosylase domain-containing protein [Myxococcales bacterium]|nr:lytic transglycosylase domain-containing protein [Myxococcales bacterium]
MKRATLFALLFTLGASTAEADLYRYVDKNGTVHITNLPKRRYRRFLKSRQILLPGHKTKRRNGPSRTSFRPTPRVPSKSPTLAPDTKGDKFHRFDDMIRDAAKKYQIPVPFIKAVIKVESGYNPRALSWAGAMGLMQLMPGTARTLGVTEPYDPRQNIFGGVKYLRILANRFNGDLSLVLSGYHAGEGAVVRKGGIPFQKTDEYVRMVLAWYYRYKERMPQL